MYSDIIFFKLNWRKWVVFSINQHIIKQAFNTFGEAKKAYPDAKEPIV